MKLKNDTATIIGIIIGYVVGLFAMVLMALHSFHLIPKNEGPGYTYQNKDGITYRWTVLKVKNKLYYGDLDSARAGWIK